MNDNPSSLKNQRSVKSYVIRQGRITPAQENALKNLWEKYVLSSEQKITPEIILDIKSDNNKKEKILTVEIGFGMGHSLAEQARINPEQFFIGIEVHKPGVGSLLLFAEKNELNNLKIFCHDAVEILENNFAEKSIDKIQIFFPDPWPKKRHHKRRIIQPDFIKLLHRKLKPSGILHLATDWENYAEHMQLIVNESQLFKPLNNFPHNRPLTKFEQRGKKLGHQVWDLVFEKH